LGAIFVAGIFGPQAWDITLTQIFGFFGVNIETTGNFECEKL